MSVEVTEVEEFTLDDIDDSKKSEQYVDEHDELSDIESSDDSVKQEWNKEENVNQTQPINDMAFVGNPNTTVIDTGPEESNKGALSSLTKKIKGLPQTIRRKFSTKKKDKNKVQEISIQPEGEESRDECWVTSQTEEASRSTSAGSRSSKQEDQIETIYDAEYQGKL